MSPAFHASNTALTSSTFSRDIARPVSRETLPLVNKTHDSSPAPATPSATAARALERGSVGIDLQAMPLPAIKALIKATDALGEALKTIEGYRPG
jgi:hypothetical protein